MRWAMQVYRCYMRISFSSAAAYRADFFFSLFISLLSHLLVPLLTALIYMNGASIPGWTFAEALTVQAVFMLCAGVCAPLFGSMVWIAMQHIREGTYDLILLKPGPAAFLTASAAFNVGDAGMLLGGLAMFVFALFRLPDLPGSAEFLRFGLLFLAGLCMNLGCILLMTATAFKWVGNGRIYEIYDAITMFGRYPAAVFPRALQGLSAYLVPVAMMGYFPAAAVMGRADPRMYFACLPCGLFLLAGCFAFNRMIRAYQSAGG